MHSHYLVVQGEADRSPEEGYKTEDKSCAEQECVACCLLAKLAALRATVVGDHLVADPAVAASLFPRMDTVLGLMLFVVWALLDLFVLLAHCRSWLEGQRRDVAALRVG